MTLDGTILQPKDNVEKYILRKSFDNDKYLPNEIIWRKKEAFSDGVGGIKKPFFKHIQEYIKNLINIRIMLTILLMTI